MNFSAAIPMNYYDPQKNNLVMFPVKQNNVNNLQVENQKLLPQETKTEKNQPDEMSAADMGKFALNFGTERLLGQAICKGAGALLGSSLGPGGALAGEVAASLIAEPVTDGVMDVGNGVADGVSSTVNGFKDGISNIAHGNIGDGIKNIANGIFDGPKKVINGVGDAIKNVASGILDVPKKLIGGIVNVGSAIGNFFSKL